MTSAGIVLLALSTTALTAVAQAEAVRVSYQGGRGCPPPEAFRSALLARTEAVRFASGDEGYRMIRVRVSTEGARATGRLEIELPNGVSRVREIDGETCKDVVDALALVAALTIESTPAPSDAFPPSPRAEAVDDSATAASSGVPPKIALGSQLLATGGPAPRYLLGMGAFVELASGLVAGRATIAHLPPTDAPDALATFTATGGGIEACFPRLEAANAVAVSPCVGLEAAWLRATGDVGQAEHANKVWIDATATAHIEIGLLSALWLDGFGGITVPFTHYSYEATNPPTVLYETPVVAATFGVGLGVRIP